MSNTEKIDLLPCPFCGRQDFHRYSRKIGFDVFYCVRCYCCAETIGWTEQEAEQNWNARAKPSDPGEVDQLRLELSVTKKLYAEACQASYDFGAMQSKIAERDALLRDAIGEIKYYRGDKHACKGLDIDAAETALSASAEPSERICTHPEGCTQCSWCGFTSERAEPSAPECGTFRIRNPISLGMTIVTQVPSDRIKQILHEVRPFFADGTRDATEYLQLCADIGLGLGSCGFIVPDRPSQLTLKMNGNPSEWYKGYAFQADPIKKGDKNDD